MNQHWKPIYTVHEHFVTSMTLFSQSSIFGISCMRIELFLASYCRITDLMPLMNAGLSSLAYERMKPVLITFQK